MTRWTAGLLVAPFVVILGGGCRPAAPVPQFIVSVSPLPLLSPSLHPGFCVAVDPNYPEGWW